jgi:hypothetical protein
MDKAVWIKVAEADLLIGMLLLLGKGAVDGSGRIASINSIEVILK